jgi:hypothetical protein
MRPKRFVPINVVCTKRYICLSSARVRRSAMSVATSAVIVGNCKTITDNEFLPSWFVTQPFES